MLSRPSVDITIEMADFGVSFIYFNKINLLLFYHYDIVRETFAGLCNELQGSEIKQYRYLNTILYTIILKI